MIESRKLFAGRKLLAIGGVAYLLLTLATFPARVAANWFAPDGVSIAGVSGTVWSGRAETIVSPQFRLSDTTWRTSPFALLTARLRVAVTTHLGDGTVESVVSFLPGGATRLSELTGVVPVSALSSIVPAGMAEGRIGLDFDELLVENDWFADAHGTADIVALKLLVPVAESLGSYELAFSGADEDGLLRAVFRDTDGPLEASGTLELLPGQVWKINGTLKARAEASNQLRQALTLAGPRNADGGYTLTLSSVP